MLRICVLLIGGFLGTLHPLSARWQATVKSIWLNGKNTRLYLNYEADQGRMKRFDLEINFRVKGSNRIRMAKELSFESDENTITPYDFFLEEGVYDVNIDIRDKETGVLQPPISLDYTSRVNVRKFTFSDIFLSYDETATFSQVEPLLLPILLPEREYVYFFMEVYAPGLSQIDASADLFNKTSKNRPPSTHYESLENTSLSLPVTNGKTIFSGRFEISRLTEGEYLIQIRVSAGGINERHNSTSFIIEGNVQDRIFNDTEKAIQMMEYAVSPEMVRGLLRIGDDTRQQDSMIRVWNIMYPDNPKEEMENYFRQIYVFLDSMAYPGETWQSDRARIFLRYGKPDSDPSQGRQFTRDGKEFERWTYIRWDLSFIFERRNKQFVLID